MSEPCMTICFKEKWAQAISSFLSARQLRYRILVLLLICGAYHLHAASVNEEFTVNSVKYKVTDATNFYVTALGIADNNTLTEINIPEQVTNNDETFTVTAYGGLGWTDDWHAKIIRLPETVTTIKGSAFSNYKNVTEIDDSGISSMNQLEELDFPDNGQLKKLTWQAVSALPALKILRLPRNLEEINNRGINACGALEEIDIPDGSQLKRIDEGGIGAVNLKLFNFKGT